jgi:hypothetical protein
MNCRTITPFNVFIPHAKGTLSDSTGDGWNRPPHEWALYTEEIFFATSTSRSVTLPQRHPRQLEGDLSVCDVRVGVVIDGLEIRDETVHETQRVNEILELEGSRKLVAGWLPAGQPRHDVASSLVVRFLACPWQKFLS